MYSKKRNNIIYCLLISIIYLLFICYFIFSVKDNYLNYDESFTFNLIHKNFSRIIYLTSLDVHPFLYYFIAKLFIMPFKTFTNQLISLRILSSIPYFILLIIGNTTIKKRFGKIVSFLFMFSILTMPLLTQYFYIIRMYSLAMLFITIIYILFIYVYKNFISNSYLTFLAISVFSILAAYTHYVSLVNLFIIYLMFFILFIIKHKRIRYLFLSGIITFLCYIPWLVILFKQMTKAKSSFWSSSVTLKNILVVISQIFYPFYQLNLYYEIIYLFGLVAIIFMFIYLFIKYNGYKNVLVCTGILLLICNFVIFLIISLGVHHTIFISRYFEICLGAFYLSISYLLGTSLDNNIKISYLLNILFILIGITSFLMNIHININESDQDFQHTFYVLNAIPKNYRVIYSNYKNTPVPSFSSYVHNEIVLGRHIRLYEKVFNFKNYNKVFRMNKNIHYVFIRPIYNNSKKGKIFYNKNIHMLKKRSILICPNDPNHITKFILYIH